MTRPGPRDWREELRARGVDGAEPHEGDERRRGNEPREGDERRRGTAPAPGSAAEAQAAASAEAEAVMGAASDPAGDVPMPAYPRTRRVVAQPEAPASPQRVGAAELGRRVSAPEPAGGMGSPEHGDRAGGPEPVDRAGSPEPADRTAAPEQADRAGAPAATGPEPEEDELAVAVRERGEYLALAQRVQADFENFRRRTVRDRGVADARAKAAVVRDILPVADNLERALLAVDEGDPLAGGVRLVLAELHAVLERTGIEPIEAEGEPFDPTVHEALTTRVAEGTPAGVVLDVAQKGYRLGDALIRPARVVVSA